MRIVDGNDNYCGMKTCYVINSIITLYLCYRITNINYFYMCATTNHEVFDFVVKISIQCKLHECMCMFAFECMFVYLYVRTCVCVSL